MLSGLTPWIVYWILVGHVPHLVAALVGLAIAVAGAAIGTATGKPGRALDIGAVAAFSVIAVLTWTLGDSLLTRWILPVSFAGLFMVTLVGAIAGGTFVRPWAAAGQPADVVKTPLFDQLVATLTRIWIATFAVMTVSSAIPPIVGGAATTPLAVVCSWVVPFAALGVAALASGYLPGRMLAGIDDVVRETSFVAYDEATIDELYYLAREHANREAGPGKEVYNVKVGGMGTPLTGDESRKSWPSTYKVRDKVRDKAR
jgi:hypothetical protein